MTDNWTPDSPPSEPINEQPSARPPVIDPAADSTDLVFEDLSLGQALAYLFWRPAETARLFWRVLTYEESGELEAQTPGLPGEDGGDEPPGGAQWVEVQPGAGAADLDRGAEDVWRAVTLEVPPPAPGALPARDTVGARSPAWWPGAGVLLAAVLL
ncbi:MAG: hypothetical protein GX573_14905, partial [Chloroflexi bacterium]|nr:hypothetical protein [Chloroflexota bacterium]